MQLRKPNGQFLPAPVKIGSSVLNNYKGFNPGFTFGKVYVVTKTFRCKDRAISYGERNKNVSELKTQWEFCVIDDDGLERRGDLRAVVGNANTPEHMRFSKWEVIGSPKNPLRKVLGK